MSFDQTPKPVKGGISLTLKFVLIFLLAALIPTGVNFWVSRQTLVEQAQAHAGGWRLVSPASDEAIMKPASESSGRMLLVLCLTLAVAAALGRLAAQRLIKPLVRLTAGAKTIAGGNYGARVEPAGSDEIATLSEAFNQMAGALEKRVAERDQAQAALALANSELEGRVAERTWQLAAAERTARESEEQLNAYFNRWP